MLKKLIITFIFGCAIIAISLVSIADENVKQFDIPSQALVSALLEFSEQSGYDVIAAEGLTNRVSVEMKGSFDVESALTMLLHAHSLTFDINTNHAIVIKEIKPVESVESNAVDEQVSEQVAVDELIVKGLRGSMQHSLNIKRNADYIADVVTQEETGKFPDANVAESLQRVTGISISRSRGGQGQFVSVGGLGQQFNLVTLNDRILATDNIGREFSFDVLPSEIIAEVQVIKSPSASVDEGSVGATVKMSTVKPLANKGEHFSMTVGSQYDGMSDAWGKRLSTFASNTFNDDRVGVSLGVAYAERKWRTDLVQSFGFTSDVDVNNDGVAEEYIPLFIAYPLKMGDRKSLGVSGAVAMEISPELTTSIDILYTKYDTPEEATYQTNNFNQLLHQQFRPGSVVVDENKSITHFIIDDFTAEVAIDPKRRNVITKQYGSNTQWQPQDAFTLTADFSYSSAHRNNSGDDKFWVAGIKGTTVEYTAHVPFPYVDVKFKDGRSLAEATNQDMYLAYMQSQGDTIDDVVEMSKLTAKWGVDEQYISDITVGISLMARDKKRDNFLNRTCAYCGYPYSFAAVGINPIKPFPANNFLSNSSGNFPRAWPMLDVGAVLQAAKASDGTLIKNPQTGEPYPLGYSKELMPVAYSLSTSKIHEESESPFIQVDFEHDNWRGNIGARMAYTRDISSGVERPIIELTDITGSSNTEFSLGNETPISYEINYYNFLPSANFIMDLDNNWVFRIAAAKTLSRPSLGQLGLDQHIEAQEGMRRISHNGNPNLRPVSAYQGDMSFEWYFAENSDFSISSFYKNIDGIISTSKTSTTVMDKKFDEIRPVNNSPIGVVGLGLSLQYFFDSGFGVQANYTLANFTGGKSDGPYEDPILLENLSKKSWNLVGMYEKNAFEFRLALNYRSNYIQKSLGQGTKPETVDDYMQLDFRGSYSVSDKLKIEVDGLNLLNNSKFIYSEYKNRLIEFEQFSRRFGIGIRYAI